MTAATKLSTRDSWNVNHRNTGIIAIRASVIAFGAFRNSRRSERGTLALRAEAGGGIGERAPLARELDRDDDLCGVGGIIEECADARRERPDPADEGGERDLERRLGRDVHRDRLADRGEQEPPAAAQVDEVQLGGDGGRHAAVLERDPLLEAEQHLLAQVGGIRAEVERAEAPPVGPVEEDAVAGGAVHARRALAERLVRRAAAEALHLARERDPALRREEPVEPDPDLAADGHRER